MLTSPFHCSLLLFWSSFSTAYKILQLFFFFLIIILHNIHVHIFIMLCEVVLVCMHTNYRNGDFLFIEIDAANIIIFETEEVELFTIH